MKVEVNEHRDDGRIEVTVNGIVRWCGWDREVAYLIARDIGYHSLEGARNRRAFADCLLPHAVDVMRRVL